MCIETLAAVASVVSAGRSIISGNKEAKAQKRATAQATDAANRQADLAEQDMNRRNAKKPNVGALQSANGSQTGQATTMLTGPAGVDPESLLLGKNTLMGM